MPKSYYDPITDEEFIRMSATKGASEEQDRFLEKAQFNGGRSWTFKRVFRF